MKSRLCKFIGCQNSHLSRVLNDEVHLIVDQAFDTTIFFELDPLAAEYFTKLVDYERAGSPRLREKLLSELEKIRSQHENLSRRIERPQMQSQSQQMVYYSSWYWSAIHILTSIPEFQSVDSISKRDSPMNSVQHQNWRSRAIIASDQDRRRGLHFTMIQSISMNDFGKIKQLLIETLEKYVTVADKSSPEELICFSTDFFVAK